MPEYRTKCRLKPVSQVQTAFSMSQYRIGRGQHGFDTPKRGFADKRIPFAPHRTKCRLKHDSVQTA
uniref:Uncharacterized protein n=1 Tax=Neisseria meningitidis alpha275 TaxID=295996 RepID=C6SND4_NEIME|nr:hypothetical protein predicted by Glimmer/Critica [Neisseria meningitidis alpha275]